MMRRSFAAVAAAGLTACALDTSGLLTEWQGGSPSGAGHAVPGVDAGALRFGEAGAGDGGTGSGSVDAGGRADADVVPGTDGSVSSSSTPRDSGAPEGGPPDAVAAAGDGASSPESGSAVFACGAQLSCALAGQTCCVSPGGSGRGGGSSTTVCEEGGTCSDPSAAALRCTASADCAAGEVCCLSQQSSAAASQCAAQCGGGDVQLCDPNARSSGCSGRATCTITQGGGNGPLPSGVGTCG